MEPASNNLPLSERRGAIEVGGIRPSACPFLGTDFDRVTPFAFVHPGNRCFRHQTAVKKELQFQETYCLSRTYQSCPVYQQTEPPTGENGRNRLSNSRYLKFVLPLIIVLILFVAYVSWSML